jgi:hypothetical protein
VQFEKLVPAVVGGSLVGAANMMYNFTARLPLKTSESFLTLYFIEFFVLFSVYDSVAVLAEPKP